MQVWQTATLEVDRTYRWALGPLTLWLRSRSDELHLAVERDEEHASVHRALPIEPCPEAQDTQVAQDVQRTWSRWIVEPTEAGITAQFQPVMPDRALVARPESALRLPVGAAALFFVSVPVWVRLMSPEPRTLTLSEIPTAVLSNIWFGDPMSGELCYSLQTTARREIEQTPSRPHRATCPVYIANAGQQELDIERIRVPMAHLTVYDAGDRLWTNRVNITRRDEDAGSEVEFVPGPPEQAGSEATAIGGPREVARKRWVRAFSALGAMF